MRILIAGCGDIGTQAGLKLYEKGHEVFGLKRNIKSIASEIKAISADISQPIDSAVLPAAIDQIIYILAASGFNEQAYRQAYVDGAANLIAAMGDGAEHLKRFIFVSSTSVYAQNNGEWVDEKSLTEPNSFNGQIMLEAEGQVLELPNSLVVRFSGIYGPGRNRMLEQVKAGQLATEQPIIYSNRIHSEDCARALVHLCEQENPEHQIILASDHRPVCLYEFQNWLADQLCVPRSKRQYQPPQRRAGSKRICNKRLVDTGFKFKYPDYKQGYLKLL